ncbi:MAG: hypothetical protein EBW46_09140 [Rhodobacterales bacterium]|nr:hypothetical protein [Rhodobacterales bacterium]
MHQKTCFCGKLKIKTPERPLLHFVCHCKDCDALWNGLYMGLVFPTDEIELSGEQRNYSPWSVFQLLSKRWPPMMYSWIRRNDN